MTLLTQTDAWQHLSRHRLEMEGVHMRDLFGMDPVRGRRFMLEQCGIYFDYAKHRVTNETLALLVQLAKERGVEARREAMFSGARINPTEDRAVLHVALRGSGSAAVAAEVAAEVERMAEFCAGVRQGRIRGHAGRPFTDVVNIGIGGSDLGPKAVCEALAPLADAGLRLHFLSNPDSHEVSRIQRNLDPASTLVIVSSKTFSTQESLANFATLKAWMSAGIGAAAAQGQFVAVTAKPAAAIALGFDEDKVFRFWDWVGGRYSLWSAIGLPIMLAVGPERFRRLLDGARAMDRHFTSAPLERNMPVLMAMLGAWYRNFFGAASYLIAPYDTRLRYLPAYIQQLDMESNGKSVDLDGNRLDYGTGPLAWGDLGINGQHAFFQLVHQGTHLVPVDFIGVVQVPDGEPEHQRIVASNLLAQAEALMLGRSYEETRTEMLAAGMAPAQADALARHRTFLGNVPSSTLLLDRLEPETVGALIALYEHKVFVQGVVWGINSFDQWGVELGKQLGKGIYGELCGGSPLAHDSSTAALLARFLHVWR